MLYLTMYCDQLLTRHSQQFMRLIKIYIYVALLLLSGESLANVQVKPNYIEQFATTFLTKHFPSTSEEKIIISVASIDPRIEKKTCKVPLQANIPEKNNIRNINIKIICSDKEPWKLYMSARVQITKAVLVAISSISKGDILDNSNVALNYLPINQLRGDKLNDMSLVFGAKAKKRIARGRAINKSHFCLVCKGDFVTIVASSDNFNIKTRGMALSSGNINDQVRVRNTRSNKVILPRVKNAQQVFISL